MVYRWTFRKDPLKLEKICEWSTIKFGIIDYGVTMDLQKKFFIEPAESCPHWLKIILWKKLGRLAQKYRIAITI